jgi:hypothetical protein
MIKVTERAKKELKKLLAQKVDWSYALLRLVDRGEGILGLGIDIEMPGDMVVVYKGQKILVIEPSLVKNFERITLDIDDTQDGPNIVIVD